MSYFIAKRWANNTWPIHDADGRPVSLFGNEKWQAEFLGKNLTDGALGESVYDWTQTSDAIHSGDLIFLIDGNKVAVVVFEGAWPVQISGPQMKHLHHYKFDPRYKR